jgi:Txe/YoeB family toxin of Txe-Axe toxin-antitoxin module
MWKRITAPEPLRACDADNWSYRVHLASQGAYDAESSPAH